MTLSTPTLKSWLVFTLFWIPIVFSQIYQHYTPLLDQSNFIYNPMINSRSLQVGNQENLESLKRSFISGTYNIYSFGIPGKVEVTFSKQFFQDGHLETWMPDGVSIASVRDDSPLWRAFKETLIQDALQLRKENAQKIFSRHAADDALWILAAPLLALLATSIAAARNRLRMSANRPRGKTT